MKHQCTVTLLHPTAGPPSRDNSLLIDPCFTTQGVKQASQVLTELHVDWDDLQQIFITHPHGDHLPRFPMNSRRIDYTNKEPGKQPFKALQPVNAPGHHPEQQVIGFDNAVGDHVIIGGDAVLNRAWLTAWQYYYPNGYHRAQIIETWRTVAKIIAAADVIVPGHGDPIIVDIPLVAGLLQTFPSAEHANACPEVPQTLATRLTELQQ